MSPQCSRFSFIDPADIEAIIASEKEVWNREKLSLQKALKRAEAKVYKLKAELRNDALLRSLSPDSEHAALQVGSIFMLTRGDRPRIVGPRSGCPWAPFLVCHNYSVAACREPFPGLEHAQPCFSGCQQCGPTSWTLILNRQPKVFSFNC